MAALGELFEPCVEVDPTAVDAIASQLAAVPDKPAVYLLATEDDQPVLLASGLAVRSILRRRLGEPITEAREDAQDSTGEQSPGKTDPDEALPGLLPAPSEAGAIRPRLSRRADLRPIVRRLYLHPTFSRFETDLWYLWLARRLFPDRYRELIRRRHCWMICGDPAEKAPRLVATDRFSPARGRCVGPLPDRSSANRLIEVLTGLFELCHYYQVLRQAPHGRACEYKEMGRCAGPCDGTITMDEYRGRIAQAMAFAADGGRLWREQQARRMADAAKSLRFEQAGRIKQHLARAEEMDHPRYRWLADAEELDFLIVQPGAAKAELRTFRSFGGRLVVGPILARKSPADGLARWIRLAPPDKSAEARRAEEAGLLADYLFRGERDRGLFVRHAAWSAEELARLVSEAFPPTRRKATKQPKTSSPEPPD